MPKSVSSTRTRTHARRYMVSFQPSPQEFTIIFYDDLWSSLRAWWLQRFHSLYCKNIHWKIIGGTPAPADELSINFDRGRK